ncbi:MAG: ribonuclease P protein component [Synechococcaceae cyanobacterium]|nr:ribonuclease P protein component [Synechococcaceae cyanobacterium]
MALPKHHRLRGHRAIDRLHRQGRRHHSPHLLLRVLSADESLLPPPDRRAHPSPWRCALVISAKVNKRAVVRNRLRRLLHRHLLAHLQCPVAADASGAIQPGPMAPSSPGPAAQASHPKELAPTEQHRLDSAAPLPPREEDSVLRSIASAQPPVAALISSGEPSADGPANRNPERPAGGWAIAARPLPAAPIWLMVSLRPGSADLDDDQLLGECTFVLRRAGLIR